MVHQSGQDQILPIDLYQLEEKYCVQVNISSHVRLRVPQFPDVLHVGSCSETYAFFYSPSQICFFLFIMKVTLGIF